jgi:ABC-type multidrug transport system permease subunit
VNPLKSLIFLSSFRSTYHADRYIHRGQGMAEYFFVVAVLAVAAICFFIELGYTNRKQSKGPALEVSG